MSQDKAKRPEIVTDAVEQFMNDLRDGGTINMMGSGAHLEAAFNMTRRESREVVMWWISQ